MKKLIPAFALLLISAIVLSTASFAWFSMNTTVSATGMQVSATTASSLVIANSSGDGASFSNSAGTATAAKANLVPVSTADLKNWFYVSDSGSMDYNSSAAAEDTVFKKAADSATLYYQVSDFYIKVQGADASKTFPNLFVQSITVKNTVDNGDATKDISKALRVGVLCGEKAVIYAPTNSDVTTYKAISAEGVYNVASNTTDVTIAAHDTTANLLTGGTVVNTTTEVNVKIFVWYEGQDTNCTSANSVNIETLKIDVNFTATNA